MCILLWLATVLNTHTHTQVHTTHYTQRTEVQSTNIFRTRKWQFPQTNGVDDGKISYSSDREMQCKANHLTNAFLFNIRYVSWMIQDACTTCNNTNRSMLFSWSGLTVDNRKQLLNDTLFDTQWNNFCAKDEHIYACDAKQSAVDCVIRFRNFIGANWFM